LARFADCTPRGILRLQDTVRSALGECTCLEQAARRLVDCLFDTFSESIVLVRFFAALPYSRLPQEDRVFVSELARGKGAEAGQEPLEEDTLVLSLLGTRGALPDWNDRLRSRGHRGIPLLSERFVQSIPMLARLLHELDVSPKGLDSLDHRFVELRLHVGQVGLFYVPDARTATDAHGRLIISAQDFVAEYGVKTVFGLGGIYPGGTIPILLVFTRDRLEKEAVYEYTHLITVLRAATAHLVRDDALYSG
jgi:hypothetical protein